MSDAKVRLAAFLMPVYLKFADWAGDANNRFPVAMLTDKEAAEYWDALKPQWLAHVKKLREQRLRKVTP